MKSQNISRFLLASGLACLVVGVSQPALAHLEDSSLNSQAKSTAHYDIILAFGRCLALPAAEVQTIANYDQATDALSFNGVTLDFTDRKGSNNGYFHAPQVFSAVDALSELKKWSDPAQLGQSYVPASLPLVTSQVSALSGTPAAFGVYLHSLADRYSHMACTDAHFVPHCGGPFPESCSSRTEYNYCHYRDSHIDEFGTDPVLTKNTAAGLTEVFKAMSARYGKGSTVPTAVQDLISKFSTSPASSDRAKLANAACR